MLPLLILSVFTRHTLAESCPGGGIYESTFKKCYIYYNQPAVFLAAESTCRSVGANLAEIRNAYENTYVSALVNSMNTSSFSAFWIGANLLMAPRWTWTTNDTVQYTNWAADQPPDTSIFQCSSVRTDNPNLWNKELCSSARSFVCTADPRPDPPAPSPCDPGYTQYGNQCFGIFKGFIRRMNYYDSNRFCLEQQNATLPKIPSLEVQDFLYSFIANEKSDIWLGLTCWGANPNYCQWWDITLPAYNNYLSGQPSGAHPVRMTISNGGQWVSSDSFWLYGTIIVCEKPARI